VNGTGGNFSIKPRLHLALHLPAKIDVGNADVSLRVAAHVLKLGYFLGAESFRKCFREQRNSVAPAHSPSFYDRPVNDLGDVGNRDLIARELFGNEGTGR